MRQLGGRGHFVGIEADPIGYRDLMRMIHLGVSGPCALSKMVVPGGQDRACHAHKRLGDQQACQGAPPWLFTLFQDFGKAVGEECIKKRAGGRK